MEKNRNMNNRGKLSLIISIILLVLILYFTAIDNSRLGDDFVISPGLGELYSLGSEKPQILPPDAPVEGEIPVYIRNSPCAEHFIETGICGGICESGECTQTGKSCYCKL